MIKPDHLREALRYFLLPPEERIAEVEKTIGDAMPPPYLDTSVMDELRRLGFTQYDPVEIGSKIANGSMVMFDGDELRVGHVTAEGRAFLRAMQS